MKKVIFNLVFNRKKRLNSEGKALIQVEAYQNRQKMYFSTNVYVRPNQWDQKRRRVKNHPNMFELNQYLDCFILRLERVELELLQSGHPFSLKQLREKEGESLPPSFISFMRKEIELSHLKESTRKNHLSTVNVLVQFRSRMTFDDLTFDFLCGFERYLLTRHYHWNTIAKHMKHIKKYVNLAINKDLMELQKYPFRKYKIKYVESKRQHLMPSELLLLEQARASLPYSLRRTLDMFLFCCYTGLRFSDVVRISVDNFRLIEGKLWLIYSSTKTRVNVRLPLFLLFDGKALSIYEYYRRMEMKTLFGVPPTANSTINKQLKRIDEFESLGMYECAAYFLSEDQCTSEIAASTYKALMRGENSGVEIAAINSWGQFQKSKTQLIGEYVKNFMHPVFCYESSAGDIEVTPCSLVSGNELAIHMGLPRHSVCGLPVIEHANFGQEIVTYDRQRYSAGITLGNIFNMGNVCNNKTVLNLNSLAMHTFVTGSTGSGKSNTIYEIIRQLDNFGVSYLVIEPAKGEYKNIFGNYPDVHVFGTNPQFTEILRINPFKFPKGVHVLEHIDRLVELLNVCWPMYAAMPAVLKEAILQTYQACGWDLMESRNRYSDELFPTFRDLLDELVIVITRSAYSEEVKSNYIGSLVTRVKSLTNGLNSQIFSSDEVDNTTLFDKKVIVDISRIGSVETKSLIMGILIMRLNEYRVAFSTEMNMPLRHVTVLEEAHNILKRVSTEQNIEGANVAGKSVEMLSNAIAEMRTYGEGFIIADQSPSAVDISAIRNTNTKIIMRLPDEMDRRMAGKAAGLKDNQLDEIAKLPKGVAVVYQNDWVESVLCKVNRFRGEERAFKKTVISDPYNKDNDLVCILQNLLHKAKGESLDLNIKELTLRLINLDIDSRIKIQILKALRKNGTSSLEEISPAIYELLCSPEIEKEADNVESIEEWKNVFVYSNYGVMIKLSEMEQNQLLECILREEVERNKKPVEYLEDWKSFLKKELM